ncbi:MAG: acetyltransferase [Parafilimonas sp.]
MKKNIIIIGSSGYSKVVIDLIEKQNLFSIVGLTDAHRNIEEEISGYKILGKEEDLPNLIRVHKVGACLIAIGDNWIRKKVYDKILLITNDMEFVTAIHPSAQIAKNVTIDYGTVIMAGAIINSNTKIGKFTIINTKASIDHDCLVGDFASLAPNATTGGDVKIGDFTAVSISATIKHGVQIGEHTVIGAGAVAVKNIGSYKVAYGVPAKEIRGRTIGEKYL